MSAKIEYKDKEISVFLSGEIDHHSASLIRASIDDAIIHKHPSLLVLDFSAVTFMDSSGIAVVINAMRHMNQLNGSLSVTGLGSQPMRVFRASGIDKLVEIKEVIL